MSELTGPPAARLADDELPDVDLSRSPWPARTEQVGGVSLLVRSTAGGPRAEPALYLHGLGGASTNWTDLSGQLSPWLDGEAIDLPGFGRSGPAPDGDYSLGAHARTVISYLQRRREAVHLLGNSMGGAIAIVVAARRPDLIRTLTLISPAVPDLRPRRLSGDPLLPLVALPGVGSIALRRLERMDPERRARGVIELCFADPSLVPPQRIAEAVAEIRYRSGNAWTSDAFARSLRGLIGSYFAPASRSMWARMSSITAPTLVVWGDRDRLVDVVLAPRVARTIPDARLLVLPGVGHVAQMERPQTTARAILGLLHDVAAGDGSPRRVTDPHVG